jgi:hypothetical protein
MMFDYARDLHLIPSKEFRHRHRFITPRYFSKTSREHDLSIIEEEIEQYRKGKFIGQAILQALENGRWTFERIINDHLTESTMIVKGIVTFTPIKPSLDYVLYKEEGKLRLRNGIEMDVSHYYIYHYNIEQDTLDISFSTIGTPEIIDRPFVSLKFIPSEQGWESREYHKCSCDDYHANYLFRFQGLNIHNFRIQFDVEGPEKNYRATTEFQML